MNVLAALKKSPARRVFSTVWHCAAPSITVSRRVWDLKVYLDLRDNIDDLTRSRAFLEGREADMMHIQRQISGLVWDVGCNIGFFAFPTALSGKPVVSFDISEKAIALLNKTAARNRLNITTVPHALTVSKRRYVLPRTSYKENRVQDGDGDSRDSITYLEAAERYGEPRLLKMDIEGGEREFFESTAFKQWLLSRDTAWLVELHPQHGGNLAWNDVPCVALGEGHVALYHRDAAFLARIRPDKRA